MNTNLKNEKEDKITNLFLDLLKPKSDEDKITFEAQMIHLNLIAEITELMQLHGIASKKELASLLGTTSSYITQLFSGEKLINLKLLARLQRVFDTKFVIVPQQSYTLKKNLQNRIFNEGYKNKYDLKKVHSDDHQKKVA
jgi:plasmid maintenance system antidote protein VapI